MLLLERAARGRLQETPHHMSTNDPALESSSQVDQAMLLQAALVQLRQLTERVSALEAERPASTQATPSTGHTARNRGRVPYLHHETGWQPAKR